MNTSGHILVYDSHKGECRIECIEHHGLIVLLHKLNVHRDENYAAMEELRKAFKKSIDSSMPTFRTPVIG